MRLNGHYLTREDIAFCYEYLLWRMTIRNWNIGRFHILDSLALICICISAYAVDIASSMMRVTARLYVDITMHTACHFQIVIISQSDSTFNAQGCSPDKQILVKYVTQ